MRASMPARPNDLTPEFLTELVTEMRPGLRVSSVAITGVKTYGDWDNAAPVSTSARVSLELTYDGVGIEALPCKVLAKMSFADETVWCGRFDPLFETEVAFYKRLRPELDIQCPVSLGGRFDPASRRYVLLLEDLRTQSVHFNSILEPCDASSVQALVETLARLHASYWNSPRFTTDLFWVPNQLDSQLERLLESLTREHVVKELEREHFKREFVEQIGTTEDGMYDGVKALKRSQAVNLPQTLLHGDPHFGNTYTLSDGRGGLFDWQLSARGFGIHDFTYLIVNALSVAKRRAIERELITLYREQLRRFGVADPPSEELLWLEYRRAIHYVVFGGWMTASRDSYGWETCVLANLRGVAAYQDHDTGNLISDLL